MNFDTIAELTIAAFKEDENLFYVLADALDDVGDHVNAKRYREGNWSETDYNEALTYLHRDILSEIRKGLSPKFYKAVIESRKYTQLVEFLLKNKPSANYKSLHSETEECRSIGKAARALHLIYKNELDARTFEILVKNKYNFCVKLGLYKEAVKWRKLLT